MSMECRFWISHIISRINIHIPVEPLVAILDAEGEHAGFLPDTSHSLVEQLMALAPQIWWAFLWSQFSEIQTGCTWINFKLKSRLYFTTFIYIYIYSFALFTLHIYLYALNVLHYLYCSSHIPCSILFTFHSIYIFYCTNLIIVYYIVLYFIIVVFFCVSIVSYDLYYHVLYYCMIAYCFRLILLQYIIFLSYCML